MSITPCIICILKGAQQRGVWSHIVSYAGSTERTDMFSHVDVVVHHVADGEKMLCAYSSYMHELLTLTRLDGNMYDDRLDVALAIPVSIEEAKVAREFLDGLVRDHTTYNLTDLALCMMPEAVQRLVPDVPDDAPIKSVFCSQLAVLTIRRCLSVSAAEVRKQCRAVNSRCTTPNALYDILSPLCPRVRVQALCTGQCEPVPTTGVTESACTARGQRPHVPDSSTTGHPPT